MKTKMKFSVFFVLLFSSVVGGLLVPHAVWAGSLSQDLEKIHFNFPTEPKALEYDDRMLDAARIATEQARKHSLRRCWHAVKNALLAAHVISSRPTSKYAWQAGYELERKFGFTKINVESPFDAPIGSVLVYGGGGAGHVEIRTAEGFASDFMTTSPSHRPLLGVYVRV